MRNSITPDTIHDKLRTTGEVAKILNVSKAWLEYHRWKGDGIPFVRIGTRTVRYRESDLRTWLESQNTFNGPKDGGRNGR